MPASVDLTAAKGRKSGRHLVLTNFITEYAKRFFERYLKVSQSILRLSDRCFASRNKVTCTRVLYHTAKSSVNDVSSETAIPFDEVDSLEKITAPGPLSKLALL